ncbi:F-box only protein 6-like [Xiphophorus couchianus]|uniref:F-box only protein 6-like n=1 Tax=Xiphophorus couchianus TaxID=32473 RepID=UPI001015E2A0|nr:F-box only protein 6-like [Xiphophorus couchianus]
MKRTHSVMMGTACSDSSPSPNQSSSEPVIPLPLDILEEIFLNLPRQHVVCVCRLVCRQWKDVADSESFWRERCRREGYQLRDPSKVPSNWRLFYFLCKKRRNLIKNPRAEDEFQGWRILKNGGDKWKIEGSMVKHSNPAVQKNFVTSYGWCTKEQVINLMEEGYNPSFMDEFQPHIRISDWMLHVFKDYGPGVRYVRFNHGGKDTQFWAGWYGIRVTESCVEVCPALDN